MTKLYQIVNEYDEIIGHKERHKISWEDDIYRISAVWLTNSKKEVLIAKRVLTKDKDPGKWGPAAAGTLEEGEDYESNAYKEADEELGLTGVKFQKGPKHLYRTPRKAFCQWYIGMCDKSPEEFTLQADEVAQVRWINADELKKDVNQNPNSYVTYMETAIALL